MSATNAFETAIRTYIMEGVSDATWTALAAATNFYISLHTASPGETGDQTSNEAAYTGYARVAVARGSSAWTTASGASTNDATITFGQCTASPGSDITHVGIGLSSTGAGTLLESHALDDAIVMQVGAVPAFAATALSLTCD